MHVDIPVVMIFNDLTHYLLETHNRAPIVADIWKDYGKWSICSSHFKTIDINQNFVFEIMFSKLKIEQCRHNLNIVQGIMS